jgi:hypothetical protein
MIHPEHRTPQGVPSNAWWMEDKRMDDIATFGGGTVHQYTSADEPSVTLPDLGVDATVGFSAEDGVTILTGQTISGSTALPVRTNLGDVVYFSRALTISETATLKRFLRLRAPS